MRRLRLWLYLCLLLGLASAGCSSKPPDDSPAPTRDSDALTREPTPTSDSPTPTPGSPLLPGGPITLTIWTTQEFSPSAQDAAGSLLHQMLLDDSPPDVTVEVVVKRPTGPGGIMDYLQTAGQVAPSVLPDVTVLNSQMLREAAAEGMIQPMDGLVPAETLEGLFPAADELAKVDGNLVGIPFRLDFQHLIYNTAVLTDTAPITWDEVVASGGPYLFPAAEDAPMEATLILYLAAGGTLFDQQGRPHLEADPLTQVFRFYQRADAKYIIAVAALGTSSLAESRDAYLSGNALIAHIDAADYLSNRDQLVNTAAAAVPGPEKAAAPLVSAWNWAIVTPDPSRQQLAAQLIDQLMSPDNLGPWSHAGQWLPASASALDFWPTRDQHVEFARRQLLAALPHPGQEYHDALQPCLAQAVRDIILGASSPAVAAASCTP